MKKIFYYAILAAIFIAFDLVICFAYATLNLKPGGILFYALLIIAFTLTGMAGPYVKRWLKIEDKEEDKKEGSSN